LIGHRNGVRGTVEDHHIQLGLRDVWGGEQPFGLSLPDRRLHTLVTGASGTGKSSLLKQLIIADIHAGLPVVVIDPHGDLVEEILDIYPPCRADDLVLLDAADAEWPVGFNLLANVPQGKRHLVVAGIISALKGIWADSWGPRMEHILANALAALTECQNVTLLSVGRMLVDPGYQQWVLRQVRNPSVLQFWKTEFGSWDQRFRSEAIAPILNKMGALLLAPPLRNVLGQVRSTFDPRWLIDHHKVFIANLSRGRLGQGNSDLLGSLLVAAFALAAMSRADQPPSERADVTVFVDEFTTFSSNAFASMLAENRKYKMSMVLACQHLAQVRPAVVDALLGNVGNILAFRTGERDAQVLARQFGSTIHADTLTNLSNHHLAAKILQDGCQYEPFLGRTLPPDHVVHGRRDSLIRHSRERYGTPREAVEDKLRRWTSRSMR
jgi:hypothetical protein